MSLSVIGSGFTNREDDKFYIQQDIKKLPVTNIIKTSNEKELAIDKNNAVAKNKFVRDHGDVDALRNARIVKDDEDKKLADASRELLVRKAADELRMMDILKFLNQERLKQEALKIQTEKDSFSFDITDILELSDQSDIASQITDSILFP